MLKNNNLAVFSLLITSTIISISSALINGYPIVFSDTSTYIASGFSMETPVDRPIIYGILLRFFSLNGLSLWLVIGISTFLLCWLFYRVMLVYLKLSKLKSAIATTLVCLALSLLSSFSWNNSQLMPDIFTPILLLTTILLLSQKKFHKENIGLYLLFIISTSTHLSHITYNIAFLITIGILAYFIQRMRQFINFKVLLTLIGLTFLSILTMGSALSKSRHVFFMGAMVEHGIAKAYLDENCDDLNLGLCTHKDNLPALAWRFIWDEDSPLYSDEVGGWKGSKKEFSHIIRATLTEPKYIRMHISASIFATLDQLQRAAIGDGNGVFMEETLLFQRIEKYFPHEIKSFKNSLQQRGELASMLRWNSVYNWVTVIGLFYLLFQFFYSLKQKRFNAIHYLSTAILLSVFIHSWVCATFANASERFGAKMFWLILLLCCFQIIELYSQAKDINEKGES
ncbi:MAG: hypothetical protein JJT77_02175 [Crocinitomicaceae bacterium]|nr:hypothetical protein [Crocinitomicaceae bacterium]